MSNMNSKQRAQFYPIIAARDGEECIACKNPGTKKTLIIDHWDDDNGNNAISNLHFLCRRCNARKSLSKKRTVTQGDHSTLKEKEREEERENTRMQIFKKSQACEPKFRSYLFGEVVAAGRTLMREVLDSGAEYVGCSQQTIRRYLMKLTSRNGMYELVSVDDAVYVQFKPKWRK
jgi:hypothetical protein